MSGQSTNTVFLTLDHTVVVYGISTGNIPYAIEITDPVRARAWARVLGYTLLKRLSMGPADIRDGC
jgi:hypothetical protein